MDAIDYQLNKGMITKGEYYIADAIKLMIDKGLKLVPKEVDIWLDAGVPETVLETNRFLLANDNRGGQAVNLNNGVKIVPPVFIHPNAEVTASVIGPNTIIGPGCQVSYSKIENSIVEAGAQIEISQLRDSLIGERCRVIGARGKLDLADDSTVEAS